MNITIIGTGYVGLVTGAGFASLGHNVTCVDTDLVKLAALKSGAIPFFEPGLTDLVARGAATERLAFEVGLGSIKAADIVFVAVGTPNDSQGLADLSAINAVANLIGRELRDLGKRAAGPLVVVTKSTVPVGTTEQIETVINNAAVVVASNPEFLKEGDAIRDFLKPDRVVLGWSSAHAGRVLEALYRPLVRTDDQLLHMGIRSAELTKYAANAMLATRISLMNELAELCDSVGGNIQEVRRGVGADSRIGSAFLYAGIGFGGSCFNKDLQALLAMRGGGGIALAVLERNRRQRHWMANKIIERGYAASDKTIAVWGLAFKPNTDDTRDSPALEIIEELLDAGATIRAYDPKARPIALRRMTRHSTALEAAAGADALLLCTEWSEFRSPDWNALHEQMLGVRPTLFDGRNIWSVADVEHNGFSYVGVGVNSRTR